MIPGSERNAYESIRPDSIRLPPTQSIDITAWLDLEQLLATGLSTAAKVDRPSRHIKR